MDPPYRSIRGFGPTPGTTHRFERPVPPPLAPRAPAATTATRSESAPAMLAAGALFLAVFLFFWISVNPFVDRTDPTALIPSETAGTLNQVAVFALAALSGVSLATGPWRHCRPLATALFLAPLAWILVSVAGSSEPALSARRYVLTLLIVVQVVNVLTMPRDRQHFSLFLAVSMLAVLVICYSGIVLKPGLTIHSADDVTEPMHAGHWRGPFVHKNAAGGAMALGVIVSIYVASSLNRVAGILLGLASGLFLVMSVAKTSIALLPLGLVLAEVVLRVPFKAARYTILVTTLSLFALLTVGSVVLSPVRDVLSAIASDPTYTNRTEIWSYALSRFSERPLIGQGFEAFWRSGSVFYAAADTFASTAANGHNGYLDVLLTTGLPGLLFCLGAFVVQPMIDLQRSLESGADPATTAFFARLWVFGLLYSFLESIFFNNTPGWFMFLMAVIGLRFLASARVIGTPKGSAADAIEPEAEPVLPARRRAGGWR